MSLSPSLKDDTLFDLDKYPLVSQPSITYVNSKRFAPNLDAVERGDRKRRGLSAIPIQRQLGGFVGVAEKWLFRSKDGLRGSLAGLLPGSPLGSANVVGADGPDVSGSPISFRNIVAGALSPVLAVVSRSASIWLAMVSLRVK